MQPPDGWIVVHQTADDRPAPTCDFCGACPMPRPVRAYPAEAFAMAVVVPGLGDRVQEFMGDGWTACANCWPSVEAESVPGLLVAFLHEHPEADNRPGILAIPRTIFENFFAHRSGPGVDHEPDSGPPQFPPPPSPV